MKHLTCILFLLISGTIFSQFSQYRPIEGLISSSGVLNINTSNPNRFPVPLSTIQGSPYLQKNFGPARLIKDGKTLGTYLVRYNIYSDVMEIKMDENMFKELVRKPYFIVDFNSGEKFRFYPLEINNYMANLGYFEILEEGETVDLLKKYKVEYFPAETVARAYHQPEPAKFKDDFDYFFYFHNEDKLVKIDRIKEKKIYRNLKEENISVKTDKDKKIRNIEDLEAFVQELN